MATKSSSAPSGTSTSSEAVVLSSEVSTTSTTASPATSTTTAAAETSIKAKLAFGLRLGGECSAMSSSSSKSRGAESLRLLTKVIEAKGWGRKGSKLSHLVTLGLALVLLQT